MWNENRLIKSFTHPFPYDPGSYGRDHHSARLVAAVSNAGGLGSLAAGYSSPKEIKEAIDEIRDLTEQPFAVNLFAPCDQPNGIRDIEKEKRGLRISLASFRAALDIPASLPKDHAMPSFNEQMELLLRKKSLFSVYLRHASPAAS